MITVRLNDEEVTVLQDALQAYHARSGITHEIKLGILSLLRAAIAKGENRFDSESSPDNAAERQRSKTNK